MIDFGIVGVGTLFPDSRCFFPQGFHCTGFNEVGGEAGLMVVVFCIWSFRRFGSLSARRGGVLEKLLGAGDMGSARVERVALPWERWGQAGSMDVPSALGSASFLCSELLQIYT